MPDTNTTATLVRQGFERWVREAGWLASGSDTATVAWRAYVAGHFDGRLHRDMLPAIASCDACDRKLDAELGWTTRRADELAHVWICPDCDHLIPQDQSAHCADSVNPNHVSSREVSHDLR